MVVSQALSQPLPLSKTLKCNYSISCAATPKDMDNDMDINFYPVIGKIQQSLSGVPNYWGILYYNIFLRWPPPHTHTHTREAKQWSNHAAGICLRKQRYTHTFPDKEAFFARHRLLRFIVIYLPILFRYFVTSTGQTYDGPSPGEAILNKMNDSPLCQIWRSTTEHEPCTYWSDILYHIKTHPQWFLSYQDE